MRPLVASRRIQPSLPATSNIPKMAQESKVWILSNPPEKEIQSDTFELKTIKLEELKEGEVLLQVIYLSNDPAQRGWIQKDVDPERLYVPPVGQGNVMRAGTVSKVIKSKSENLKEGDRKSVFLPLAICTSSSAAFSRIRTMWLEGIRCPQSKRRESPKAHPWCLAFYLRWRSRWSRIDCLLWLGRRLGVKERPEHRC